MAKKKDLLGDFSFSKFENLGNGVEIPISNSLKTATDAVPGKDIIDKKQTGKGKAPARQEQPKSKGKANVEIPAFDFANKKVSALINVVPTSVVPATPKRESIKDRDIDLTELGALTTKEEKVLYLAMRGWSLKVEQRRNGLYHYATKYIKRKKKRIYLGPISR
jgi:hypothetical protein